MTENGIAAGSAGLITVTAAPSPWPSRPAIAGYSDLTGSIASQGSPAAASCSSRCRTVCDLPAPVAPVTRTCRFRVASGTANSPTGRSRPSRIIPRRSAPACPARPPGAARSADRTGPALPNVTAAPAQLPASPVSLVRSKWPESTTRSPGTSRHGRPTSGASTAAVAGNGASASLSGSAAVARSASARRHGVRPVTSRYGWWLVSTEPTSTGASKAASAGVAAPARTRTSHRPASRKASSSARRRWVRSAPNRDCSSSWRRSTFTWVRSCAISLSRWSVGSATTSQPNGLPVSAASADSNRVGWIGCACAHGVWSPASGRAWRPGQSTHTRLSQAANQPGPAGTPRAPGG